MKNAFTRRLMQGLMLSCSLFTIACNENGMPLAGSPEELETISQELRRTPWTHVDIGSAAGGFVTDGFTCNAGNDIAPTCGANTSNVNLTWVAPVSGTYTFTTAGATYDTVLQVNKIIRTSSSPVLSSAACNDDAPGTAIGDSSVTLTAVAGEEYLITVDGWGCGYFKLNISAPSCSSPPGACWAGTGTWNRHTNSCDYAPVARGTTCDDGNASTINDSCNGAGVCQGVSSSCTATVACGGFECGGAVPAGTPHVQLYGGNNSLSPWSIRGHGVDKLNSSYFSSKDGVVSLDMNAAERASLSQDIATTPGQYYEVTFWVLWNTYPGPASLVVEAAGKQQLYGWTIPNQSEPAIGWMKYTFGFTANASTTTLSFHSSVPGTIGARLDAVSIACAVP
jgi:hypothetical protein